MKNYASILPGARVRGDDGFIGTVERLEHHWADRTDQPDRMIVRSDDNHWRYSIPLMFVSSVTQGAFHPIVLVSVHADELTHYILGRADEVPLAEQPTTVLPQGQSHTAAPAPASAPADGQTGDPASDGVMRMPIREERLIIHKHPVVLGKVHIHRGVETQEQSVALPVYHEEAIVEHIPPDQYDGLPSASLNETIIPIVEERLVVKKETVVKEYLRVRKQLVPKHTEVQGTVRREVVQLSEQREDGVSPDLPLLRDMRDMRPASHTSADDANDASESAPPA